jgi:fructose-1,6-bisphosphatase-3
MNADGSLMTFSIGGEERCGKAFLDYADTAARQAYYYKLGSQERILGCDFLWYLWAGRNSPIFGRDRMTTFERRLIDDKTAWEEPKNAYYTLYEQPEVCDRLLKEFGLEGPHCHIINGHIPVKVRKGESPVKGGGKLLVIDGGFCRAYQSTSGIAGYTLIYDSYGYRIVEHQPFAGRKKAIEENWDITSTYEVFERMDTRQKIAQTDIGRQLKAQSDDLMMLLHAFKDGAVTFDQAVADLAEVHGQGAIDVDWAALGNGVYAVSKDGKLEGRAAAIAADGLMIVIGELPDEVEVTFLDLAAAYILAQY